MLGATPDATAVRDVALAEGRIVAPGDLGADARVIDCAGLVIAPGLIDMHVHVREPGGEHKETIETGCASAVAGGFTAIGAMPNTQPVIDTVAGWQANNARAAEAGTARLLQYVAVTMGQQGAQLADLQAIYDAGCVAFSDDGRPVESPAMMAAALRELAKIGAPVLIHAEELSLVNGPIHAGAAAAKLGISGIDPLAEELMTLREVFLAEATGGHVHICHVSTARAAEIIRRAKAAGAPVTGEVCPHHMLLTDARLLTKEGGDVDAKMNPPLRSEADRQAMIAGMLDGTLDVIASDHAPHAADEKARGLADAPFGIVGLETTLPLLLTDLVAPGIVSLEEAVRRMTVVPAQILDLPLGTLDLGAPADVTIIDMAQRWTIRREELVSKSKNTPFDGKEVTGRAALTIVGGNLHPVGERGAALLS